MLKFLSNAWALLLGLLLLMIGNGLQGTLLGVRGEIEGFSTFEMSLIMSAYFVGFLGGSKLAPEMIRRVGHVRVFAALGSLISAVLILYPSLPNPWVWMACRVVIGFCFCGVYVTAESWLNNAATNETRGQALSHVHDGADGRHHDRAGPAAGGRSRRVHPLRDPLGAGVDRLRADPAVGDADARFRDDQAHDPARSSSRSRRWAAWACSCWAASLPRNSAWRRSTAHAAGLSIPEISLFVTAFYLGAHGAAISRSAGCRTGWTGGC